MTTPWLRRVSFQASLALWLVVMLVTKLHFAPTLAAYHWGIVFLPVWAGLFAWTCYLLYLGDLRFYAGHRRRTVLGLDAEVSSPPELMQLGAHAIAILSFLAFTILLTLELQTPNTMSYALLFLPLIVGLSLLVLLAWAPYALAATDGYGNPDSYYYKIHHHHHHYPNGGGIGAVPVAPATALAFSVGVDSGYGGASPGSSSSSSSTSLHRVVSN